MIAAFFDALGAVFDVFPHRFKIGLTGWTVEEGSDTFDQSLWCAISLTNISFLLV